MRVCVAAAVVLLVVLLSVAGNAFYVHTITDRFMEDIAALPEMPDPSETPARVAALRAQVEAHLPWLGLSVNFSVLDRVTESLLALEAHARSEDVWQYAATLATLRDLVSDLARLERFSVENIL